VDTLLEDLHADYESVHPASSTRFQPACRARFHLAAFARPSPNPALLMPTLPQLRIWGGTRYRIAAGRVPAGKCLPRGLRWCGSGFPAAPPSPK
jgi:hypothetical protein